MASRFLGRLGDRVRQIRAAFTQTRAADPRLVLWMVVAAVLALVALVVPFALLGSPIVGVISGLFTAAAAAVIVLGIRSQRVAIAQIEGQPGAALAVLQSLRGAWTVTPAVAFNGRQDMVHRVVGRPGVVLVGEGRRARVKALLKQESRRTARVAGDVPVHEINVGTGADQLALSDLRTHLTRLPRRIKAKEIGPLDRRLHALGGTDLPIPKGPIPQSRRPR